MDCVSWCRVKGATVRCFREEAEHRCREYANSTIGVSKHNFGIGSYLHSNRQYFVEPSNGIGIGSISVQRLIWY
ncbi:hypothetical protein BRADI_2g12115v3 [Brachypodium distachyon]|uniref:Uncharacterized protein n=1 Tax=Brachypodium distachyon TaxID=15368 RepID=A0A2K2D846_BRADI|nr:hypothetical protein BRADI_2g12115v3 [Brachypodium distachyon]